MSGVRITQGRRSREVGTTVGIQLNVFGLTQLKQAVNGKALAAILYDAALPMKERAYEDWPKDTEASADSIDLVIVEDAEYRARVVLQAGGEKLTNDPRNKRGIDYAPYLEFGTNGRHAFAVIRNTVFDGENEFKARVREGVAALIRSGANGQ